MTDLIDTFNADRRKSVSKFSGLRWFLLFEDLYNGEGRTFSRKGMRAIFQKKSKKMFKKEQNIWKFGQKCTKFENILKKGKWLRAIITRNKLLEKALGDLCKQIKPAKKIDKIY